MAAPYVVKIASTTLTSNQATITFSGIPSTYAHLWLLGSVRSTRASAATEYSIYVNSDSTSSNYRYNLYRYYTALGANPISEGGTGWASGAMSAAGSTASNFASLEMFMVNYASNAKTYYGIKSGFADTGTISNSRIYIAGVQHNSSAVVSSINLYDTAGAEFAINSSLTLYGIKDS